MTKRRRKSNKINQNTVDLGEILQGHVLPHLGLADLSSLAQVCSHLRTTVSSAPGAVWQQAVKHGMPWHPDIPPGREAAQATLQRQAQCSQSLSTGQFAVTTVESPIPEVDEGGDLDYNLSQCGLVLAWIRRSILYFQELRSGQHTSISLEQDQTIKTACWHPDSKHISICVLQYTGGTGLGFATYDWRSGACVNSCGPYPSLAQGVVFCKWSHTATHALCLETGASADLLAIDTSSLTPVRLACPDNLQMQGQDMHVLCTLSVSWAPDNTKLAVIVRDIFLFDVLTGSLLVVLGSSEPSHQFRLADHSMWAKAHKSCWVPGTNAWLTVYDTESARKLSRQLCHVELWKLSVCAGDFQMTFICNLACCQAATRHYVDCIQVAPDGSKAAVLLTSHFDTRPYCSEDTLCIVTLTSGQVSFECKLHDHSFALESLLWSPSCRWLVHVDSGRSSGFHGYLRHRPELSPNRSAGTSPTYSTSDSNDSLSKPFTDIVIGEQQFAGRITIYDCDAAGIEVAIPVLDMVDHVAWGHDGSSLTMLGASNQHDFEAELELGVTGGPVYVDSMVAHIAEFA